MADTLETIEIEVKHRATGAAEEINRVASAVRGLSSALGKTVPAASHGVKEMTKAVSKAKSPLENFISSLKRIAFYRFIRSIIKSITQAFSEGLEKAYIFSSRIVGEGHRFATALDQMQSRTNQMKGQLGSAFAALLTAIAPILETIINLVTRVADAISQFFAAFTGSTYLKAIAAQAEFADKTAKGAKAAKDFKNQLMKFDEINRLEDKSSSGSGGTDKLKGYSFEDTPIMQSIKNLAERIKELVKNGDWDGLGRLIGQLVNKGLQKISINAEAIGRKLVRAIRAGFEFLLGFLDEVDWTLIGKSIMSFLGGAISEATDWLTSTDWEAAGQTIYNGFKELFEGFDWEELANSIFELIGLALGSAVEFLRGLIEEPVRKIRDYFAEHIDKYFGTTNGDNPGAEIAAGILDGIVEGFGDIAAWVWDHIFKPFIDGFKKAFGIDSAASTSSELKAQGEALISGLQDGVSAKWNDFSNFWSGLMDTLFAPRSMPIQVDFWSAGGLIGGGMYNIPQFASGGAVPEDGLFMMNHNELIGQFSNGRTAVANNEQIIAGIEAGVYRAMSSAMSGQGGNRDIRVYLDGKEIGAASRRYERNISRATGVAMA